MTEYDLVLDVLRHRPRLRTLRPGFGPAHFDDESWCRASGTPWSHDVLAGLPGIAARLGLTPSPDAVASTAAALADLSLACGGTVVRRRGPLLRESDPRVLVLRARAALLGTVLDPAQLALLRLRVAPLHPRTLAEAAVLLDTTRYDVHRAELDVLARLRGPLPDATREVSATASGPRPTA